jgi:hypothetical protein
VQRVNRTDWLGPEHLWLANVTLTLPVDEYVAVAAMALGLGKCMGSIVLASIEALAPGIVNISLPVAAQATSDNSSVTASSVGYRSNSLPADSLLLARYVGFGVNATDLRLLPAASVAGGLGTSIPPPLVLLSRCAAAGMGAAAAANSGSGSSSGSGQQEKAVSGGQAWQAVVGGVLGSAAGLLLLAGLAVVARPHVARWVRCYCVRSEATGRFWCGQKAGELRCAVRSGVFGAR